MYSIIIPPEYLGDLCNIREETKISIRKQTLEAVKSYLKRLEKSGEGQYLISKTKNLK